MRTLILALLVTPMFGAQAWVQNGPSTCNAVSGDITCTLAVTAGHTLHIGLAYRSSTPGVTSVVSSLGNTPVLISSAISPTSSGTWLYCEPIAASGSETITVTVTGPYFFGGIMLQEFSGSTCTVDGAGSNYATGEGTLTCSSFTPATANTLVVGTVFDDRNGAVLVAGSGYAANAITLFSANSRNIGMEYKIVTASASQAPTFTVGANGANWSMSCAALKATGGAPTGAVRHRVSQ